MHRLCHDLPTAEHQQIMSELPPFTVHDGKKYTFEVHPEANCCLQCLWLSFSNGMKMEMTQRVTSETEAVGTLPTKGPFPFSPCPCCTCCGCGPMKGQWRFTRDAIDTAKWNGVGSVFSGGCCEFMTHHKGDTFYYDAEHLGTKEKPFEMLAGKNQMNPPCAWGKKFLILYESPVAGAPETTAMER